MKKVVNTVNNAVTSMKTAAKDTVNSIVSGVKGFADKLFKKSEPANDMFPINLQLFAGGKVKANEVSGKTGPKPFGIGAHNEKISEVASHVTDGRIIAGGQRLPEKVIPTPNGLKGSRRPDILVEKPDGSIYGINVGKTTKSGAPVKREMDAINDLEDADIPMHFVPYYKK